MVQLLAINSLAAPAAHLVSKPPCGLPFVLFSQVQQTIELRMFTPNLGDAHITGLHQVHEVEPSSRLFLPAGIWVGMDYISSQKPQNNLQEIFY
jgi:hypothetical protein